jgi:hypothetical protein
MSWSNQIVYNIAVNYDMTFCVTKIKYIMYNVQDYGCLCNDSFRSVICVYNGKIEVTVSGRKLNIDVKWDVKSRNEEEEVVSLVCYTSSSWRYIKFLWIDHV